MLIRFKQRLREMRDLQKKKADRSCDPPFDIDP